MECFNGVLVTLPFLLQTLRTIEFPLLVQTKGKSPCNVEEDLGACVRDTRKKSSSLMSGV